MKCLIIRFSSIGDIVLTTPVIRCLKNHHAESEVHFLTKRKYLDILKANPYLDTIYTIENKIEEVLPSLKSEKYDYIIDLHHNLRSNALKLKLLVPSYSIHKVNIEKWLMVRLKLNVLPQNHIVDRYLSTLSALGIKNDNQGLDYFIDKEEEVDFHLIPNSHQENFVAFAIGGTYATKRLPKEKILKICKGIHAPIYILGGPEDKEVGIYLSKNLGEKVYNGCGTFSLNHSASIIQKARVVITHDTGLMHIAAAFKKDIVSVWGNTIPEFGMGPYMASERSLAFEVKGLKCRPCSKLGHKECPKKHFRCMEEIDHTAIIEYVNGF